MAALSWLAQRAALALVWCYPTPREGQLAVVRLCGEIVGEANREESPGRRTPMRMIPYTDARRREEAGKVLQYMLGRGLIPFSLNAEALTEQFMGFLDAQGLVVEGKVVMGKALLLPPAAGASGFELLFPTPCLADRYDDALRPIPPPIQFAQTAQGEVILPARWLRQKLQEAADNPTASPDVGAWALTLARQGNIVDVFLPPDTETVAMRVPRDDGTDEEIEALPGGFIIEIPYAESGVTDTTPSAEE